MKAAAVGFILLVFSVMMAGITHSDLFTTTTYYEDPYADAYGALPANVSSISEDQQYTQTMDIVGILFSTLAWGWIYEFVPYELHAPLSWFVSALTAISWFLISIGFVELFTKREIF